MYLKHETGDYPQQNLFITWRTFTWKCASELSREPKKTELLHLW